MNMRYFPAIVKRPSLRPIHGMFIIFLVLSALFVPLIPLADAQGALITVDPPSITGPLPGDQFGVDIYITEAVGVHAWEVELLFDKKVLHVTEFIEGDFLMGGGMTSFYPYIDNPTGYASCAATGDLDHFGVWGEGILATVIFEVMGGGNSLIDIYNSTLFDRDKNPLLHMAEDGYFAGMAPYAKFTYSPSPISDGYSPAANQTVTFDAGDSYDPDGTIANYHWDWGDGTTPEDTASTVIDHVFTQPNVAGYIVNLTVTDDDPMGYEGSYDSPVIVVIRDVAVTGLDVSPENLVRPDIMVEINVTVCNYGTFSEGYNVAAYYDDTLIDEVSEASLASGQNRNSTFDLDTTGFAGGTYIIKANVTSVFLGDSNLTNNEFTSPLTIIAELPPVASFTWSPLEPLVGEVVTFTSTSTDPDGTVVSWAWDFDGDDVIDATTEIAAYTYTTAGTYAVSLTVIDDDGLADTDTHSITIRKFSSSISITASPTTISIGESLVINGSITPARVGAEVTIWHRKIGELWSILATATTNETSQYSYIWTPSDTGTYEVNASWLGDENTLAAESSIVAIEVIPPRILAIKLTGEHDYLLRENVKIRLAAHVKDSATTEPISDADVTIQIFDADGVLWVSDIMVEKLVSTGIYEWESEETIKRLRLEKGVYLVHVTVSSEGSLTTSDILAFHIDPPGEDPMQLHWILLFILAAALATTVSVWYADHRRLTRKLPELQKRMYYPSNFPFF